MFFEGEDAKYYFPRIEKYSGYEYTKIIHYNCGGKKGVLKALNLVEKNRDEIYTAKAFLLIVIMIQQNIIILYYIKPRAIL